MSYDKTSDLKSIQADVLTTNTTDNELISSLKQLKTDNKSVTKAINALNEQLGNAQTSASDAVARVVELETVVTQLQAQLAGSNNDGQETGGDAGDETGDETGNETGGDIHGTAEHVMGMVLVEEGNKSGTWVRVDRDFNTVEFNPEHGTWAGMKQVQNETYGEFTEIPITYVRTETLQSGPYAGKNCWWTADAPMDGFHVHPAFIGQDGQPHNLKIASYVASKKSGTPYSEDKGKAAYSGYWNNMSYNTIHDMGWMSGGARPYSIYDHHLLARLMLTEFGTSDVQVQTVDGVAWTGANRINYHGIYDPFGCVNGTCWLDGLTTLNGTNQVLAANGSRDMIETGISCPGTGVWPTNCRVDQANGINFGDLFIASDSNSSEDSGSFADYQYLISGCAFYVCWNTNTNRGAFYLDYCNPTNTNSNRGWRVALCS